MKKVSSDEKLSEQYLLRVSPILVALIDEAFSKHLKKTGEYISKSEFIRNILQTQCNLVLGKTKRE
jgi:hypothetical protein